MTFCYLAVLLYYIIRLFADNTNRMVEFMQVAKKICLLGDFSVGKTSLVRRFTENRFDDRYLSTIGVKVSRKVIELQTTGQVTLTLMIWDTSGSEPFNNIVRTYYQGAAGALLVCDLTREETLASLAAYAQDFCSVNANVPLVVLANKVDLHNERAVPDEQVVTATTELGAPWLHTSAKTGAGVDEAFHLLGQHIYMQRNLK